ncbi:unnamed protein product [Closterium sp. NIES-54]
MTSLHRSGGSGDGGGGSSGSGGGRTSSHCGAVWWGVSGGGQMQLQRSQRESFPTQQLCEWYASRSGGGGSSGSRCAASRCFSSLSDTWHAESGAAAELPRWLELHRQEAAALGASESAILGTAPAETLHTFTLDSGASRCFFRDSTTLTPLSAPVPVRLADPSGGPVLARSSTVLPCPAVPSGSLSGLHLPSFSTNLVNTAALQDAMVTTTTLGDQRPVAPPCSCRLLSHQTLLWHHRLGHPSRPRLRGMHSRLLVSGLPRSLPPLLPSPAPPCLPCVEGRQRTAPHSSSFPPKTARHGPRVRSQMSRSLVSAQSVSSFASGSAKTFLSCICTLTKVVSSPPTSCGTFVAGRAFSSRSRLWTPLRKMGLLSAALA